MAHLWKLGYAPEDIIGNVFRVAKNLEIKESLKLEFIQVYGHFIPLMISFRSGLTH